MPPAKNEPVFVLAIISRGHAPFGESPPFVQPNSRIIRGINGKEHVYPHRVEAGNQGFD